LRIRIKIITDAARAILLQAKREITLMKQ